MLTRMRSKVPGSACQRQKERYVRGSYLILFTSQPPGARETGDGKARTRQGKGKGSELKIRGISNGITFSVHDADAISLSVRAGSSIARNPQAEKYPTKSSIDCIISLYVY